MAAARIKATDPVTELAGLAARREELREQRTLVEATPRPYAEAEPDVDRIVELAAAQVNASLAPVAAGTRGYADVLFNLTRQDDPIAPAPIAVLAAVAPELVREFLAHRLRDAYADLPEPMPAAARAVELAKLDRAIAAAERQAAEVWWRTVDAGMTIDPPDLPGEALLGLELETADD